MNKGSDIKAIVFSAYYEPEVAASLYLSTNLYEDMAGYINLYHCLQEALAMKYEINIKTIK